jgi:hypothetical protein
MLDKFCLIVADMQCTILCLEGLPSMEGFVLVMAFARL